MSSVLTITDEIKTNGSSTIFVKLVGQEYGVSDVFGTRSQPRNNLYTVLQILKVLGRAIL